MKIAKLMLIASSILLAGCSSGGESGLSISSSSNSSTSSGTILSSASDSSESTQVIDQDKIAARFGFKSPVVNALQNGGANGFGLLKNSEIDDLSAVVNQFATDLGQDRVFPETAFLDRDAESPDETAEYDVSWVSPTGIPALAFYDQGDNPNWTSYADATQVAPGLASDSVDAIVFDGLNGLNNIIKNDRNYVLARWISGGTFYLVSTKHASLDEYEPGQSVEAFVKTGNASQAFLKLAKDVWNWGDLSSEGAPVTWEAGVAAVKNTLETNHNAYDWYLVAQPVLFACTNTLKQAGVTLNVAANLQVEWAEAFDGARIPAAGLFVNKTRYAAHKGAIDQWLKEVDERIENAIDNPSVAVAALNSYGAK